MKPVVLLYGVLIIAGNTFAGTATEIGKGIGNITGSKPVREAGEAYSEGVNATFWQSRCNQPESDLRSSHCFMTPSGKRVWELPDGPDKVYWLKVGDKKRHENMMQNIKQQREWREQADRRLKADQQNDQHCQFWMDQADSERRDQKLRTYCR